MEIKLIVIKKIEFLPVHRVKKYANFVDHAQKNSKFYEVLQKLEIFVNRLQIIVSFISLSREKIREFDLVL